VSDYRAQMAMAGHNGHQLKRIVLPSGKTIEVVYFDQVDRPAATNEIAQPQRTERELHVCEHCESDLVYPTTWEEADEKHWSVSLRCPNCEHFEQGVYSQDECDRFDDHLEAGTDALTRDFKRLMAANMAEEIDRFVAALDADAIQPMDF
jgi:RNase P subunit RPR2